MRTVLLPLKHLSRRLDAVLASVADQTQAKVKRVLHFPNQVEVARRTGHGPPILKPFGGRLARPPARQPSLSSASHSHPSTPQGGYDVPFQFHHHVWVATAISDMVLFCKSCAQSGLTFWRIDNHDYPSNLEAHRHWYSFHRFRTACPETSGTTTRDA